VTQARVKKAGNNEATSFILLSFFLPSFLFLDDDNVLVDEKVGASADKLDNDQLLSCFRLPSAIGMFHIYETSTNE
jgi:hypothetical protein